MIIATTAPFTPQANVDIEAKLLDWNLSEDLAVKQEANGCISVYALGGATSWPYEWTPNGDDLFETFELATFLDLVAKSGQMIKVQDSEGSREIYLSARTRTPRPH